MPIQGLTSVIRIDFFKYTFCRGIPFNWFQDPMATLSRMNAGWWHRAALPFSLLLLKILWSQGLPIRYLPPVSAALYHLYMMATVVPHPGSGLLIRIKILPCKTRCIHLPVQVIMMCSWSSPMENVPIRQSRLLLFPVSWKQNLICQPWSAPVIHCTWRIKPPAMPISGNGIFWKRE